MRALTAKVKGKYTAMLISIASNEFLQKSAQTTWNERKEYLRRIQIQLCANTFYKPTMKGPLQKHSSNLQPDLKVDRNEQYTL